MYNNTWELTKSCAAVCQSWVGVATGRGSGWRRQGTVGGRVRLVAVARSDTKWTGLGFTGLESTDTGYIYGIVKGSNCTSQLKVHSGSQVSTLTSHLAFISLLTWLFPDRVKVVWNLIFTNLTGQSKSRYRCDCCEWIQANFTSHLCTAGSHTGRSWRTAAMSQWRDSEALNLCTEAAYIANQ